MPRQSIYQPIITEALIEIARPEIDPRHVEGFMRLEFGTLGHLDRATFRREARLAAEAIDLTGVSLAEENALSYGL